MEEDSEHVLRRPIEDRPGREDSRIAVGRTETGRYVWIGFVITVDSLGWRALRARRRRRTEEDMRQSKYPAGWDEERLRRVLEHYEAQSDEEAVAEDEAAYEATTHTMMDVPVELVPLVRELIAKRSAE